MECSPLAAGQRDMRPSSQAAWASAQKCGVPSTRIRAKAASVSSGNGAMKVGWPAPPPLACTQTVRSPSIGIGKRSAKPRTPFMAPK
jgi:hypothetical protein